MESTSLTIGTSEAIRMLHAKDSHVIVLLEGAMATENAVDRPTVSTLNGVGLNLAALPGEALHLLQDGVITDLRARKKCALHVMIEQNINNVQMALQRDFSISSICDPVVKVATLLENTRGVNQYSLAIRNFKYSQSIS